jgi:DNA-binding transcriptional LysR family regulator
MLAPEWTFRSGKKSISVSPSGRLRADSGEALLYWAVAGLGIVYTPSFLLGDELKDGRLEAVLDEYTASQIGVYVLRPPGAFVPAKVRTLIDSLINHFSEKPL